MMFESLSDHIKADDRKEVSSRERVFEYTLIAVLSVLLFAGLYLAMHYIP